MEISKEAKELMMEEIEAVVHKYSARGCGKPMLCMALLRNEILDVLCRYGYDCGFK